MRNDGHGKYRERERRSKQRAALLLLALVTACQPAIGSKSATSAGSAATQGGDSVSGGLVFAANCATCHGSTGTEGGAGPSLHHESSRMDYATTVSWIEDPEPPMPKLYPDKLTKQQVLDIAAYVQTL
ncbi:MAG: cytochrome c [Candidatus Eremiobacteraeota bacterium]|nr:cytochrome c [Candidatus Eremiobacteraeota bacterium]